MVGRLVAIALALTGCRTILGLDPGTVVDGATPDDSDGNVDALPSGTFRKGILLKSGVTEELDDFTVPLVRDSDPDLAQHARDDARDIHFVLNGQPLEFDLVSFDGNTGGFEAWVRIPKLVGVVEIELRYGGDPILHDASLAWGPIFAGVWHMGQSATQTFLDSTSHVHHGTSLLNGQRPLGVVGRVGAAASFDGMNDTINVGDPIDGSLDFASGFTLSAWVMVASSQGMYDVAVGKGGSASNMAGYDLELGTGNWGANVSDGVTVVSTSFGAEAAFLGTWAHLAVVLDRGTNQVRTYSNGAQEDVTVIPQAFGSIESTRPLVMSDSMSQLKGILDEVHLYNVARSAAWIDAEHRFVTAPNDLVSIGPEEAL